jgi:peptidoglycan/LPS O-acetylase OafA/YrhL
LKKLSLNLITKDSQASSMLDLIRFFSAVTVFLFHFYVPLPGYQAVMVFFVLSGYFISSSILKVVAEKRWSWSDYLLRRLTRLWIVLLPALFLTFVVAKLQLGLFGEEFSPPNLKISNFLTWENFWGNLFFLQEILVNGAFGLNGPLWSLTYEFWYYMLFPCIVLIFHSKSKGIKFLYIFFTILISVFLGKEIMSYFLIWLAGAIIPLVKTINIKKYLLKYAVLFVSALLAVYSLFYEAGTSYLLDLRVGILFAILTYLIVSLLNNRLVNKNIPKYFADFSFTLYLTHYPLANLILTWRVSPLWPFEGNSMLIKISLACLVFGYAWIIGLLTEKHTDKVRREISKIVFRKDKITIKKSNISPSNN